MVQKQVFLIQDIIGKWGALGGMTLSQPLLLQDLSSLQCRRAAWGGAGCLCNGTVWLQRSTPCHGTVGSAKLGSFVHAGEVMMGNDMGKNRKKWCSQPLTSWLQKTKVRIVELLCLRGELQCLLVLNCKAMLYKIKPCKLYFHWVVISRCRQQL